jgi:hypothetical protein
MIKNRYMFDRSQHIFLVPPLFGGFGEILSRSTSGTVGFLDDLDREFGELAAVDASVQRGDHSSVGSTSEFFAQNEFGFQHWRQFVFSDATVDEHEH